VCHKLRYNPHPALCLLSIYADVTALLYDEQQHVIYTGAQAGLVHIWAPG
jgi:hypothetical protein